MQGHELSAMVSAQKQGEAKIRLEEPGTCSISGARITYLDGFSPWFSGVSSTFGRSSYQHGSYAKLVISCLCMAHDHFLICGRNSSAVDQPSAHL
jgi:hypothetical protein